MRGPHPARPAIARSFVARKLAALKRDDNGFTAVEFAMVIGPFLALLFAIMEVALLYFGTFSVENAMEQAARKIRTGEAQTAGFNTSDFKDEVCSKLPAFMDCDSRLFVDVRSFDDFASAAAVPLNPIDDEGEFRPGSQNFSMGDGSEVVLVTVYYNWQLFASFPNLGLGLGNVKAGRHQGNRVIIASTAFRNEPFSAD
ncbi:MAG: TadE/TadG family type IV pilus assembly protein [Hyphomicrobiaceae bacterium]